MPTVAEALRQHAPGYLAKYADRVPLVHRKVLSAILRCRTGQLGHVLYGCQSCEKTHWVGRSCGNRHCPNCQKQKTARWLQRQTSRLLKVQHFVVTFTVPSELRSLLRHNQRAGYEAIFQAGSQTIRTLLANDKNLGSDKLGFFGALHTWGRDLKDYHPHVHFVVPGGGVSPDGSRWLQVPPDRLFHPLPAKQLYKKLFVQAMRKARLYHKLPPGVLKKDWVVNIKPVGDGQAVLKYLAPYIYRVAISDKRIVKVDQEGVAYQVKPSGTGRWMNRHATGEQFVRSFVQHILPSGFQKVRYYGFMSPNSKLQLADAGWLVWLWSGENYWIGPPITPTGHRTTLQPRCSACGGVMILELVTDGDGRVLHRRAAPQRGPPCAA